MESNSAIEIEPDIANCRQRLHNFIEQQQFRFIFSFFNLNSVWGNQKTNYDKKNTTIIDHQQQQQKNGSTLHS